MSLVGANGASSTTRVECNTCRNRLSSTVGATNCTQPHSTGTTDNGIAPATGAAHASQLGRIIFDTSTATMTVAFASLFLLAVVKVGVIASLSKPWDPRTNDCQISLNSYHFNLCPLLDERHNSGQVDLVLHHETSSITSTIVYNISLIGPLRKSGAISDHEQVSPAPWNWGLPVH